VLQFLVISTLPQRRHRRLWVAPAIILGHLGLCYACVQTLSNAFYFSRRVVLLHMLLVTGGTIIFTAVAALAIERRWITRRITLKFVLSATATIALISLSVLYLGDFAGNYFWGDNLNYRVVREFWALALPNQAPFYLSRWVYVAALVASLPIFVGYWFFAEILLSTIAETLDRLRTLSHGTRRALGVLTLILALACGGTAFWLGSSLYRAQRLNAEPIAGFFLDNAGLLEFSDYAGGLGNRSDGPSIRATYARNQSFEKKNIILIVVDSLRADHMALYGYGRPTTPFLSGLFQSGHLRRVEMALSTCAETNCGVMSTLTSRAWAHYVNGDFSLDQLLHDQGYQVYRLLSSDHNWHGLRQMYGNEQTLYFDSTNSQRYAVNDDSVVFEGLDQVPPFSGTPAFFQFHLMSAHSLGVKHDRYQQFQPSTVRRNLDWLVRGDNQETLTNTYDNGVLEADATIETLFQRLREKGYLANSLCVILGDHGEGLGERGPLAIAHMNLLYQEDIHIPLLIYDETDVQYRNLSLARQIDVAPTIVDRLGLAKPSSWEGHSLLDGAISQYSYHESGGQLVPGAKRWHGCYGVVRHVDSTTYKYLQCGDPPTEELYDLTRDPSEKHDLSRQAPAALMEDVREHLRDHLLGEVSPAGAERRDP